MVQELESFDLNVDHAMDVVTLSSSESGKIKPLRIFLLFGEHARE